MGEEAKVVAAEAESAKHATEASSYGGGSGYDGTNTCAEGSYMSCSSPGKWTNNKCCFYGQWTCTESSYMSCYAPSHWTGNKCCSQGQWTCSSGSWSTCYAPDTWTGNKCCTQGSGFTWTTGAWGSTS